ncbi:uncharacterized protein LOC121880375 [Homarus americanus]|uniref:uncharacterized protein LOC121880375 n=1 Tax=Homarus americanus TaxID=6706 RepID=UPI001C488682|nr:uncharacterized protein LOC121880375 [Homarus americanus]
MLAGVWEAGMTTEVHHDLHHPTHERSRDHEAGEGTLEEARGREVDWSFLYGRGPVHRRYMGVLVLGPVSWALTAATQLMAKGVFGDRDTLLVAPVGGVVQEEQLCPHVPLAVRVVVLEVVQHSDQDRGRRCWGTVTEARLEEGGKYSLWSVGCWRGGQLTLGEPLLPPVTSLKGATLSTVIVQGFNEVVPVYKGGSLMLEGELGGYLTKIRNNLDFNLDIHYVQGFGVRASNGSFSGVIGMVQRREVDFAAASLSVLSERAEVLDYCEWFGLHNTRFITKVPSLYDDYFILFQIYSWQAWCVIVGFLALASTMLALTWGQMSDGESQPVTRNCLAPVTTILKTAVYMASVRQPGSSSGRVVLVSTWMVVMVLVGVYRGNLTAFLSIPRISTPPETIAQLIDMDYTLSISLGFSQYLKMKTSPIRKHQVAFSQAEFRQDRGILPTEEYIQRVKDQPLGLLVTVMAVSTVMDKYSDQVGPVKVCTLKSSSEALFLEIGAIAFPKNSPIKALFDRQTNWIRSTALKVMPREQCILPTLKGDESEALDLVKMGGVMVLWAAGVVIATLTFLLELFLGPYKTV